MVNNARSIDDVVKACKSAAQDPKLNILNYAMEEGRDILVQDIMMSMVPRYQQWEPMLESLMVQRVIELLQDTYGVERRKSGYYESTHPQRVLKVYQAVSGKLTIDRGLTKLAHDLPEDKNKEIRKKLGRTRKEILPERNAGTVDVRRMQEQVRLTYSGAIRELKKEFADLVADYFSHNENKLLHGRYHSMEAQYMAIVDDVFASVDMLNHLRRDRFVRNYVAAIPEIFSFKSIMTQIDSNLRAAMIYKKLGEIGTKLSDRVALAFEKDEMALREHFNLLWNDQVAGLGTLSKATYTLNAIPHYMGELMRRVGGDSPFSMSWIFAEVVKDLVYTDFTVDMISKHFFARNSVTDDWRVDQEWYDPNIIMLKDVLVSGELSEIIYPTINALKTSGLINSDRIIELERQLEAAKTSGDIYRIDTWKSLEEQKTEGGLPIDFVERPYAGIMVYIGASLLNKDADVVYAFETNPERQLACFMALGANFERFARDIGRHEGDLLQIHKDMPWAAVFKGYEGKPGDYKV